MVRRLDLSAMNSVLRLALLAILAASLGCRSVLRHEAEKPYRDAMQDGRMSPS